MMIASCTGTPSIVLSELDHSRRMKISYKAGERQLHQLQFRQGETDLIYRKGKFFLAATCEIPAPEPVEFEAVLASIWALSILPPIATGTPIPARQWISPESTIATCEQDCKNEVQSLRNAS